MSGVMNTTGAVSGVLGTTSAPAVGTGTDGYVFTGTGAGVDAAWEAAAAGGKVLQVVQDVKTDTASTTSSSWVATIDIAATLTVSSGSKVLIICDLMLGTKTTSAWVGINIYRGATANIYVGDAASSRIQVSSQFRGQYQDIGTTGGTFLDGSPGTGSVTYTLYWSCQSGHGGYLNRDHTSTDNNSFVRAASSLTLMEIGA